MDHIVIRKLEHLTGTPAAPAISYAIETRDRPGPAYKAGAFPQDAVWVKLLGGLMIAKARVKIAWRGEFSSIREIRARTNGSPLYDVDAFWTGRPKYGYAAVATLEHERWIEPYWAGPRSYGYEWVLLDDDKKTTTWMERKEPPRTGADLLSMFSAWRSAL